ncbi:3-phosphoshikimate 1-carboxyvinyltransferase [Yeosuana sp. MJ-SS3]|uniref:3-phosphoshikimate 1-carboxyvinyltransferase n=1 Tax=Gilvirhabdus luticola TaxID=3079858 RepID=A0ABU3U5S9_9FLAO|nr:3-phosphoshikimate 1-carboxyvinyltransferase [Yeosuana sp. MJ-SS3]MDU8885772.1 3-phosphoshikimate 1-carboxyvinyltransferase [Yeosuana sp. MJ-SS3]
MNITIQKSIVRSPSEVNITGSKSESNRLLLLQALYPEIQIENLSNSDDSQLMQNAFLGNSNVVDIHHAGTAMRFLTAYFAVKENSEVVLTGSSRMKERPIKILVDALKHLGADIQYVEKDGFPPIKIRGKKITKTKVTLKANVSSQYISALLLIASKLENGLELTLDGEVTSIPYINMTLGLLRQIGIKTNFVNNNIRVYPFNGNLKTRNLLVESDWSSASYIYSIVALSDIGTEISLSHYKSDSLQGDSVLAEIYISFGVQTTFLKNKIKLKKVSHNFSHFTYNLIKAPDIAQTIAVTCLALGIECFLTGLHTLKIKETDRLNALKTEIEKLGGIVEITDHSLHLMASTTIKEFVSIATYNDHRMAMAFAPLALRIPITIEDSHVVSKSYPDYWNDLKSLGFKIEK